MSAIGSLFTLVATFVLVTAGLFVLVKLFQGLGHLLAGLGRALGYLTRHVARFVRGTLTDAVFFAGSLVSGAVLGVLALLNLLIGRWQSSKHYGRAFQDELANSFRSLYRVALGHPLRLAFLGPVLDRLERRVPEAVQSAPRNGGRRQPGSFEGYEVLGTLPAGGSGAQLFLARPVASHAATLASRHANVPDRVVIKSFVLGLGSTLPQMIREGRALEAARRLGLLVEHRLSDTSFYYVMPYVDGEELGRTVDRLHAKAPGEGLGEASLRLVFGWGADVLRTLERFHTGGLWHKDIKPANVLVAAGRAHLVDFGLVTPLASGMTLTTHGTEYYRDPEMVRLAMRGVKVHEVDGVKFDLYSVGALLYSMVEGQFPAHGSLSQIDKRCPEALRWIIRRAMADVDSRYASAADMRADLAVVHAASDPFAVRPADLPSLGGARVPDPKPAEEPDPSPFVAAAAVAPPLEPASSRPRAPRKRARRVLVGAGLTAAAIFTVLSLESGPQQKRATGVDSVARANSTPAWKRGALRSQALPAALIAVARAGTVEPSFLVLSDSITWARREELIDTVAANLEGYGFRVLGRGSDAPGDLDLIAGARHAVQFSDPSDGEAVQDLQAFLDESSLDAILWLHDRGTGGVSTQALFRDSWMLASGAETVPCDLTAEASQVVHLPARAPEPPLPPDPADAPEIPEVTLYGIR